MTEPPELSWVADPTLSWNIVLTARLDAPPEPEEVRRALHRVAGEQGWPAPDRDSIRLGSVEDLRATVADAGAGGCPVTVGLDGSTLVIGAHHSQVDGVGLLALLHALTGVRITSRARGAGERPAAAVLTSLLSRATEVCFAPPARVRESAHTHTPGDVFAVRPLTGTVRTATLVHAGAVVLGRWNAARQGTVRRIAVAVGVSRSGGADITVQENSGWLRIRNVERLSAREVADAVASAPLVTTPTGVRRSRPVRDRLVSAGLRVMAPRLGSTLLVSHLGRVGAPGVEELAFFPVTGGGSGLSLGAVTLGGTTMLTLRARAAQHSTEGLQQLLEALAAQLALE